MIKKLYFLTITGLFILFSQACSDNKEKEPFQINTTGGFVLTDAFEAHGSLNDIWNCLDGKEVDEKLRDSVNLNNVDL